MASSVILGGLAVACSHALLRDPPLSHRAEASPCTAHPTTDGGTVDQCLTDDQCGRESVCACLNANNPRTGGNVCSAPGDCKVDSDCPPSRVCTASYSLTCNHAFAITYACHTGDDDCNNDSECTSPGGTGITSLCAYVPAAGKWSCVAYGCEG
jgi:hypothetical protein